MTCRRYYNFIGRAITSRHTPPDSMEMVEQIYAVDCMDTTYGDWQWVVRVSINGQVHAPIARCENRETALQILAALSDSTPTEPKEATK